MKNHIVFALLVCGSFLFAGVTVAETFELDGHSIWTPISEESYSLPDGRTVTRQVLSGFSMNEEPNTPFRTSQDCMFTTVTAADGSFESGGFCDAVDADGDVYWAVGSATEKGGKWSYLGGTGKFEGLTGGGTYQLALEWPDGKLMATWDGTAETK